MAKSPKKDTPVQKAERHLKVAKAMVTWAENIPFKHPDIIKSLKEKIAGLTKDLLLYESQLADHENILSKQRAQLTEATEELKIAKAAKLSPRVLSPKDRKAYLKARRRKIIEDLKKIDQVLKP